MSDVGVTLLNLYSNLQNEEQCPRFRDGALGNPGHSELVVMAVEESKFSSRIHECLSTFEDSVSAVEEMLKTTMSVSRKELLQKLDPLEQAKVDLVSACTLNSVFGFIWQLRELVLRSIQQSRDWKEPACT